MARSGISYHYYEKTMAVGYCVRDEQNLGIMNIHRLGSAPECSRLSQEDANHNLTGVPVCHPIDRAYCP